VHPERRQRPPGGLFVSRIVSAKPWRAREQYCHLNETAENNTWRDAQMSLRGVLVYCSDYKCSHWSKISAD